MATGSDAGEVVPACVVQRIARRFPQNTRDRAVRRCHPTLAGTEQAFELRPEDETLSVEAFLEVTRDRLVQQVLSTAENSTNRLRASFRAEKATILSAYDSTATAADSSKAASLSSSAAPPTSSSVATSSSGTAATASTSPSSTSSSSESTSPASSSSQAPKARTGPQRFNLRCEVLTGPHKGVVKVLMPRQRRLVPKIGRSTGPQYLKNGLSFPDDEEISTCHARIDARSGKLFLTDLDSTNGTFVLQGADPEQLEGRQALELPREVVIKMGQTEVRMVTEDA